jgi:hypothetical protein
MKPCVVVIVAVALNGCATSSPDPGSADATGAVVATVRAHAHMVRDQLRAGREALGLRERRDRRVPDDVPGTAYSATRAPLDDLQSQPATPDVLRTPRGHPARDAQVQEIRMDVTPGEMLTVHGTLQPRAAQALSRMARMAREHGGELTVTVPRARIDAASAILAAAPDATILSTDDAEDFGLVVVTEAY